MKLFIFYFSFIIYCGTMNFIQAYDKEGAEEIIKAMANDCMNTLGATEDELNTLLNHEPPTTDGGECMYCCMQESVGMMLDGVFQKDVFLSLSKMATENDEEKYDKIVECVEECEDITDDNKCKLAYKMFACLEKAAKARGLE